MNGNEERDHRTTRTPLRRFVPTALLFAILAALPASCRDYGPEAMIDPAPSPLPDRIVQTFAGDPTTTRAVTWRTDESVDDVFAEIAPADPSPAFYKNARRVRARTERIDGGNGPALQHTVLFTGLEPGKTYYYRVGSKEGWSEWFSLRAAPEREEPFRFLYFGDVQNNILAMWSRVARAAYAAAPDARFQIYVGDLVNKGNDDENWAEWFAAGEWIHAITPVVPAIGNHEYYGGLREGVPAHWTAQLTLPENGPAGMEETAYFFDYAGLRVIVLNSNEKWERQATWMDGVLRDNPNPWTIAVFHHPVYSAAKDRDNREMRELWRPLFERHRVDLVLQGHDHTYARGRQLPGDSGSGDTGPVFVVSVSGPKMYELPDTRWMDRAAENTQLFQVISIDGDTLRFEARTATGELYDAFDLVRTPSKENRLVDKVPAGVPERRF